MRGAPRWSAERRRAILEDVSTTFAPTVPSRMRRSAELAPLSREHHEALAVALRLRRATPPVLSEALARFGAFWADHGAAHFAVEEAVLTDDVVDDEGWHALVARMAAEHRELTALADVLLAGGELDDAHRVGERLRDHVRFEERVLFDVLERRLDDATRARLGRALGA